MFVTATLDVLFNAKSVVKQRAVGTFLEQAVDERIGNTQHFVCSKALHFTNSPARPYM
jgi:hypothetical protein